MQTIRVQNLSKLYRFEARPYSLREVITGVFHRRESSGKRNELWALRDVNFDVGDGETLGIVGNNGAGKSTLLKILSRITKPTAGAAEIRGRVGSLLEVGTGFHNELSGRENIFLNGAILGMRRFEIEKKFDEIVAFSEIEQFLDTPVKHYSSGMYMRLAFAVAAHLETEVLIVDEVLAVGDISFQKKCLNKMRDVGRSGRTVIFVSHDMQSVSRLCSRVIWLKEGRLKADGDTRQVISDYMHEQSTIGAEKRWDSIDDSPGNEIARLRRVRVLDEKGEHASSHDIRKAVAVEMTYDVLVPGKIVVPRFDFFNEQGVCIFVSHDWRGGWRDRPRPAGTFTSKVWIPGNFMAEGTVFATAVLASHGPAETHFSVREAVAFNVIDSAEGDTARGDHTGAMPGVVRPVLKWETEIDRD